ncbi:MAG: hypothetical protein KGI50_03790 [Patescibacteria group bacterium]|nr:hypothetical protein [Patescibacteria group bacterium]MDE2438411.1 hypothetical protein [Patescibacteria group bacterium]
MKKTIISLAALTLGSLPMLAAAQAQGPSAGGGNYVTQIGSPRTVLQNVTNTIASLFLFASVIYLVLAGFQYLTAGGDSEKMGKAKTNFTYSIIGIAIGLLAYALPGLISSFLQGSGTLQ